MTTNLAIDNLIEEARKPGHHRTKKEAVTALNPDCIGLVLAAPREIK